MLHGTTVKKIVVLIILIITEIDVTTSKQYVLYFFCRLIAIAIVICVTTSDGHVVYAAILPLP
jgi:hypothetical protein